MTFCRTLAAACLLILLPAACPGADQPETYQQQKNIVYHEAYGVGLVLDVFTPRGARNGLAIFDVASGAWHSDRSKIRDHKRAQVFTVFCRRGYTVFAVRPGSVTKFTAGEMLENLRHGVHWVKQAAGRYQIDPARLGLMGASAGGHLACLLAVTGAGDSPAGGIADQSPAAPFKAVAVFFPPTDLLDYAGRRIDVRGQGQLAGAVRRLAFAPDENVAELSDEAITERITQISPARLVPGNVPPMLLIHGDADSLVPLQQSRRMVEAVRKAGGVAELVVKKGGGHPWPTIHEEVEVMADWFDAKLGATPGEGSGE